MVEWQIQLNKRTEKEKIYSLLGFFTEKGYKFYSYKGGTSTRDCRIGKFVELPIKSLMAVHFGDIFFFPPTVSLPTN